MDDQGRPAGYAAELLQAVARAGPLDLEVVPGSWTQILADFRAGRLDALANVTIREERRPEMDFSIPHATTHGIVYCRLDRPLFKTTAEFRGKRLAVLRGSIGHLNALTNKGWGAEITAAASYEEMFEGTRRGDFDAALLIRHPASKITTDQGLRWGFIEDIVHHFHFAVHKGDSETLARLNGGLALVLHNGTFDRIYAKWIGPIEPHPIRLADLKPYFLPGLAIVLVVALVIGRQRQLNRRLSRQAQALQQSEERLRLVWETASEAMRLIDAKRRVVVVNDAYCRLVGLPREKIVGQLMEEVVIESEREGMRRRHEAQFESRNAVSHWERQFTLWDGRQVWLEGSNSFIISDPAQPLLLGIFRDVTERKAAEATVRALNADLEERVKTRTAELAARVAEVERLNAELRASQHTADRIAASLQEANANLLAANQELEAFSYSVSHDLRSPLRNITGFLDLLVRRTAGSLDAESTRFVATVVAETKRMGMLIDDLLTFSRVGRTEMRVEEVNLAELVEEVRLELQPDLLHRTVEWRVHPLPSVRGDRSLLHQVLANLLGNAVKFTRREPAAVIEFGTRPGPPDQPLTVFYVRDNGAGFNPKYVDKLFRVFQRLHNARDFEGTGIGLANVKRIINRHGGNVWAEGQPGRGATFYFTLPQQPPVEH